MSANETGPRRLGDFPVVFLSYDEPWADRNWLDLKATFPQVVRVHGVKGLDACHKAAAAAVPGDFVVTVDADTRVAPILAEARVPEALLSGNYRLDWLARNVVNGLWSGNGCVKLWPKALIHEMRTHEAAPEGALSLDHDVAAIRPGRSVQVAMPERAASTDPAATAFHAFRAGLRETAFLRSLAEQAVARRGEGQWRQETELVRLAEIWSSLGRHAPNGRWMMYGARLGLLLRDLWPDWDLQAVNDHDALRRLWKEGIAPAYQRSGPRRAEAAWNWVALEAGLRGLARQIADRGGPDLAEFDARASLALAQTPRLASPIRAARLDQLGYRLMTTAQSPGQSALARGLLAQAALLDHPAAHFNLATLLAETEPDRSRWHLAAAGALGNAAARAACDRLRSRGEALPAAVLAEDVPRGSGRASAGADPCLVLDPGTTLAPLARLHVPDPVLVADGSVLGYLSLCPVTGLPRARGVRLARADRTGNPADAVLPLVLGCLPGPEDAATALRDGWQDAGQDIAALLASLGRDAAFGDHWVLGSLLGRLGRALSDTEVAAWASASEPELAAAIARLCADLSRQSGVAVPIWTAAESRAVKRMLPAQPSADHWLGAAEAMARLGPACRAQAPVLKALARTLWGDDPAV